MIGLGFGRGVGCFKLKVYVSLFFCVFLCVWFFFFGGGGHLCTEWKSTENDKWLYKIEAINVMI